MNMHVHMQLGVLDARNKDRHAGFSFDFKEGQLFTVQWRANAKGEKPVPHRLATGSCFALMLDLDAASSGVLLPPWAVADGKMDDAKEPLKRNDPVVVTQADIHMHIHMHIHINIHMHQLKRNDPVVVTQVYIYI